MAGTRSGGGAGHRAALTGIACVALLWPGAAARARLRLRERRDPGEIQAQVREHCSVSRSDQAIVLLPGL